MPASRPLACIRLELQPDPELVRLVRLVVSGIASITPMELEEVEDCRAAVDEMCSTLLEVGRDGAILHLELTTDGTAVEVAGEMAIDPERSVDDVRRELSELILGAVTHDHHVDLTGEIGRFRFVRGPGRGQPPG